ncbi:MAG: hypothetical protein AAF705_11485 [Bacteroidota bacterium]
MIEIGVKEVPCAEITEHQEVCFEMRIRNNHAPPLRFHLNEDKREILPETYTVLGDDRDVGTGRIDYVGLGSVMIFPHKQHDFTFQLEMVGDAHQINTRFRVYLIPDVFPDKHREVILSEHKKGRFQSKNQWILHNFPEQGMRLQSPK